jgi:hypothetical protein
MSSASVAARRCPPRRLGGAALALTDLDSAVRDRIPSKQGARLLLARLLGAGTA